MIWIRDGHADAGICGSCGLCAYSQICECGWKSHPHYPQDKSGKSSSQRSILIFGAANISINGGNMEIGGGPYLCISVCQSKEVFGVRGCIRIWNSAGMPWKRFCTGFWQKGKSTTKEYFWKDIPGRSSGLDEIQLHLLLVGEGQETSSSNLITSISWNEFQNLIFLGSLWWEEIMQRRGQQPLCGSLKCPQRLWGSQKVWEWTL